jgi:signal transduction histidine kinase
VVLLDNALRYSHKDSTITVKVQSTDQHIVLEVSDTGVGLRYQEANLVFSRFYRGNEGVGAPTGTGLGLPVAKAIVDAHGGSISLDGEQGRGTTATVLLPLQRQLRAIQ